MGDIQNKLKIKKITKENPRAKTKLKLSIKKPAGLPGVEEHSARKEMDRLLSQRRVAEVTAREADLVSAKQIPDKRTEKFNLSDKEYRDENGVIIDAEKILHYQDVVDHYYKTYVVLSDELRMELRKKLPKKINNIGVEIGSKAAFPPILDQKRKNVSRGRVLEKMNRLKYIESDERRGLHLDPEQAQEVFDRYKNQAQAKKELVRTLISLSYSDFEICDYMEIKGHELARIKKEIFYEEIHGIRNMSSEEMFAQYKMQQMEVIKDIDVLVERFKGTKQLQALSSMIKTKADIFDKIIEKGQEFGVISKTAEKTAILVGNLNLAESNADQIEAELKKVNDEINKILKTPSFLPQKKVIEVD
jgi:hypothetical protein